MCQIRKDACGGDADKAYDIMKQLANLLATTDLAHHSLYTKRDELLTKGGWPVPGSRKRPAGRDLGKEQASNAQKEGDKPKPTEVINLSTPEKKPQKQLDPADDQPLVSKPEKPVEAAKPDEKPIEAAKPDEKQVEAAKPDEKPVEAKQEAKAKPQVYKPLGSDLPAASTADDGKDDAKTADVGKDDAKNNEQQV